MKCLLLILAVHFSLWSFAQFGSSVYVSNRGGDAVYVYDTGGNFLTEFVQSGAGGLDGTEDILFLPDGTVLVSGFNNDAIKQYDANGNYIGDFSTGYTLMTPSKMSLGPDSLVYITQWGGSQKMVCFDLNGNFVDEWTDIAVPNGLYHVRDSAGVLYVAAYGNGMDGRVMKFDVDGTYLGDHIGSTVLQGPTTPWFTGSGSMMVADWTTGFVREFDATGNLLGTFISSIAEPEGVAFLPNGDILIGDWQQDAVHWFDAAGVSQGLFASGGGLVDVNGVRVGPLVSVFSVGENHSQLHELSISPNIGSGPFSFGLNGADRVEVINVDGRLVHAENVPGSSGTFSLVIPATIPDGVYQIVLTQRGERMAGGRVEILR